MAQHRRMLYCVIKTGRWSRQICPRRWLNTMPPGDLLIAAVGPACLAGLGTGFASLNWPYVSRTAGRTALVPSGFFAAGQADSRVPRQSG